MRARHQTEQRANHGFVLALMDCFVLVLPCPIPPPQTVGMITRHELTERMFHQVEHDREEVMRAQAAAGRKASFRRGASGYSSGLMGRPMSQSGSGRSTGQSSSDEGGVEMHQLQSN